MTLDLDTFPSVAALCKEVEETTGKGVEFVFQSMHESQLSNQITARGLATHHIIRINERHRDLRHALASFQMRFILGPAHHTSAHLSFMKAATVHPEMGNNQEEEEPRIQESSLNVHRLLAICCTDGVSL